LIEFDRAGFDHGSHEVLGSVCWTLGPGAFHIVVGSSGSGKSTLVGLCHGGLAPARGSVRHFGERLPRHDRDAIAALRRRIGVIEQRPRFLPHVDVTANVAAPLLVVEGSAEARAADIEALLAWTGLDGRGSARPGALSAAERRRAAIARAVMLDPEVIVADDPLAPLDAETAGSVLTLFIDLARMGRAVLMTCSDAAFAGWAAARSEARVFSLSNGTLEAA
jgi:cell division transport system ATP-binding protein